MPDPGIDDIVAAELAEVRRCVTALENAVGQDDWLQGWEEAFWAASRLVDAADDLQDRCRQVMRKREEAAPNSHESSRDV